MRRSVPQVGRNESCPCGSGRKYKQCCLEKDSERLRHSSSIAGVTREEIQAAPEKGVTEERLERSGRAALEKLDPLKLSSAFLRGVYFLTIQDDAEKCLTLIEDTVRGALERDDMDELYAFAAEVSVSRYPALGKTLKRAAAPVVSRDEKLLKANRELQENFTAQRRQTRRLNEELTRTKKLLKRLVRDKTQPTPTPSAAIRAGQDASRYERKIAYLEKEKKASKEREYMLGVEVRQLQIKNDELSRNAPEAGTNTNNSEEEFLLQREAGTTQPIRIIDFSQLFHQRLNNAPRHVAGSAMALLGRLAGGDPAAFGGAVRLKACPSVMRCRIGSDWRLLFRLLAGRIEAVDLIPRQDLERRIKPLSAQYS
jgi:hypothetical protein